MPAGAAKMWLQDMWRQRGLLDEGGDIDAAVQRQCQQSWFLRRNASTPNGPRTSSPETSWFLRRNQVALPPAPRAGRNVTPAALRQRTSGYFLNSKGRVVVEGRASPSKTRGLRTAPAEKSTLSGPATPLRRSASWLCGRVPEGRPAGPSPVPCGLPLAHSDGSVTALLPAWREEEAGAVFLTVYDLCPCWNSCCGHPMGVGVYHSGLEIDGLEYTYDRQPGGGHLGDPSHAGCDASCGVDESGGGVAEVTVPFASRKVTRAASTAWRSRELEWDCGVAWHPPYHTDRSMAASLPLRARLPLGVSKRELHDSHQALRALATLEWTMDDYEITEHNCHHWVAAACAELGLEPPPRWLNRAANILGFFAGANESGQHASPTAHRSPRVDATDDRPALWPSATANRGGRRHSGGGESQPLLGRAASVSEHEYSELGAAVFG